jgi:hypothetical protein
MSSTSNLAWDVVATFSDVPSAHAMVALFRGEGVPAEVVSDTSLLGEARRCEIRVPPELATGVACGRTNWQRPATRIHVDLHAGMSALSILRKPCSRRGATRDAALFGVRSNDRFERSPA